MTTTGVVLLALGAVAAVWMAVRNLWELAMLGAVVAAVGAGLVWGWPVGVGAGVVGVGILQVLTWRRYRS